MEGKDHPRVSRKLTTVREFFWHWSPRLSIWNAGVWTLDMLSLHFVFEGVNTEKVRVDPELEARLQDLLHDPAVLAYKRRIDDLGAV
jgi:hypothetical protein